MPLATFKLIPLVDDFDQDFTLPGWPYATSSLTIESSMEKKNRTTWSRIIVVESLLDVASSKIKLILCDAVGDDRGDDGDVHGIDDDDKQVAPAVWRRGEGETVPSQAV